MCSELLRLLFVAEFKFGMFRTSTHHEHAHCQEGGTDAQCNLFHRPAQGRSQDLVSGGGGTHFGGGPTPYFSPQTPNHKGPPPLMYFWLPPDFGGGGGAPTPGYALGPAICASRR